MNDNDKSTINERG